MGIDNDNASRDPFAVAIGDLLFDMRVKRGWSLRQLSDKAQMLPTVLHLFESGACRPHHEDLDRLARCFGHSSCAPLLKRAWIAADVSAVFGMTSSEPFHV